MNDRPPDIETRRIHNAGKNAAPLECGPAPANPGQSEDHVEDLIDEGLEESFPASDPLAIPVPPDTHEEPPAAGAFRK